MANDLTSTTPDLFWPQFGKNGVYTTVTCSHTGKLAPAVLSAYNIACATPNTGGSLPDLDIKHMDAIQVIKMSLLEASATDGVMYEPVVLPNGNVSFLKVGRADTSSLLTHKYYELQAYSYVEKCSGVLITGKKPPTTRQTVSWSPIWKNGDHEIYDAGYMFNSCATGNFNQYAVIVYDDPHLNSEYEDGIDNFYNIGKDNPYETLIGYAHYMYWPGWDTDKDAVISKSDTARILIKLPTNSLGTLHKRPNANDATSSNPACYQGMTGEQLKYSDGVPVPLPEHFRYESVRGTTVDKFSGISGVFVVGQEISDMRGVAPTPADQDTDNFDIEVSLNKNYDEVFSLEVGTHFQIVYEDVTGNPAIVFADNSRVTDPIEFPVGGSVTYQIHPDCEYAIDRVSGARRTTGTGVILATGLTKGILVKEIHVGVDLDTPSITVYHPDGWNKKAREIAESLEYLVAPLIAVDKPAPIAFNGTEIDQVSSIKDHDPTVYDSKNWQSTPLELIYDKMDAGGGMTLTLSFLELDQIKKLSAALYAHMNSHTSGTTEKTYILGPTAEPELGVSISDGIVNSINYSYQDSSSYTISVNVGPNLVGGLLAQVDGGPTLNATEEISARATILQDLGNHIHFKVHIDGFGDRIAINMVPAVLRQGDIVTVSVHNNPV